MLENMTSSEWIAVVGGAFAWGTIYHRLQTMDNRMTNNIIPKLERHDRQITRLMQAHIDRTGCAIPDSEK